MHEVEVWVLVDEEGNSVASTDGDKLADLYDENVGSDAGMARRVVKITLRVPLPVHVELTGTAPHEGAASLSVA